MVGGVSNVLYLFISVYVNSRAQMFLALFGLYLHC